MVVSLNFIEEDWLQVQYESEGRGGNDANVSAFGLGSGGPELVNLVKREIVKTFASFFI